MFMASGTSLDVRRLPSLRLVSGTFVLHVQAVFLSLPTSAHHLLDIPLNVSLVSVEIAHMVIVFL